MPKTQRGRRRGGAWRNMFGPARTFKSRFGYGVNAEFNKFSTGANIPADKLDMLIQVAYERLTGKKLVIKGNLENYLEFQGGFNMNAEITRLIEEGGGKKLEFEWIMKLWNALGDDIIRIPVPQAALEGIAAINADAVATAEAAFRKPIASGMRNMLKVLINVAVDKITKESLATIKTAMNGLDSYCQGTNVYLSEFKNFIGRAIKSNEELTRIAEALLPEAVGADRGDNGKWMGLNMPIADPGPLAAAAEKARYRKTAVLIPEVRNILLQTYGSPAMAEIERVYNELSKYGLDTRNRICERKILEAVDRRETEFEKEERLAEAAKAKRNAVRAAETARQAQVEIARRAVLGRPKTPEEMAAMKDAAAVAAEEDAEAAAKKREAARLRRVAYKGPVVKNYTARKGELKRIIDTEIATLKRAIFDSRMAEERYEVAIAAALAAGGDEEAAAAAAAANDEKDLAQDIAENVANRLKTALINNGMSEDLAEQRVENIHDTELQAALNHLAVRQAPYHPDLPAEELLKRENANAEETAAAKVRKEWKNQPWYTRQLKRAWGRKPIYGGRRTRRKSRRA